MKTIGALLALILTISASLAQTDAQASTNASAAGVRSVDMSAAIKMYGLLKKRTVLQHPQLRNAKVSLANARTDDEMAAALEAMFKEQKIAAIPDGEHFVMIVPMALTNSVTPKAPTRADSDMLLPEASVNFGNAPLGLVLQVYADYLGKTIVNPKDAPRMATITFTQTTVLSKQEICYALETELAWSNIQLVPDGLKNVKLETIHK